MRSGEVWQINLDPTRGSEIRKTRPALIVSSDLLGALPLKIIVPITAWRETFSRAPWHVRLEPDQKNGLSKVSSADTYQVRSVSEQRLVKKLGVVSPEVLKKVKAGLKLSLDL